MRLEMVWTPAMVEKQLIAAMRTLAALPPGGRSTKLAQPQREILREEIEEFECKSERLRLPMPKAREIDEMETVLQWLCHIPQEKFVLRRVVGLRAITNFATAKPMRWADIGRKLSADPAAIKNWHAQGLAIIAKRLTAMRVPVPRGGHTEV